MLRRLDGQHTTKYREKEQAQQKGTLGEWERMQ